MHRGALASRRDLGLSGATISLPSALERWSRLALTGQLGPHLTGNQQSRHTRSSPAVSASVWQRSQRKPQACRGIKSPSTGHA
jgi:hypothetical protein